MNYPPTANAGEPYTINEGTHLPSTLPDRIDPDGDSLTFTWDVNGDGVFGDAIGPTPTLSWANLWNLSIRDDCIFTVTVQVDDGQGRISEADTTLTVNNSLPTLDAGPDQVTEEGTGISLTAAVFADLGGADTHEALINWGDGTPNQPTVLSGSPFGPPSDTGTPSGTISANHTFADNGTYTVTIRLGDDDMPAETGSTTRLRRRIPMPLLSLTWCGSAGRTRDRRLLSRRVHHRGILETHTIEWYFGDGTTSSGTLTPTHTYA